VIPATAHGIIVKRNEKLTMVYLVPPDFPNGRGRYGVRDTTTKVFVSAALGQPSACSSAIDTDFQGSHQEAC
jgi:hypothetical protein